MNELVYKEQFKDLLKGYKISEHGQAVLQRTKLLLLAGVTSSGRNTVVNELLKTGDYYYIVSDTTRKPRINHGRLEQSGKEYWFKTEQEVLNGLRGGEYLEAAVIHDQQVSGISIRELELAAKQGKIATTDIEIVGVASIIAVKPDARCVFMIPPNFTTWLERINGRGHMPDTELQRRLWSAVSEINEALSKDYFVIVVNDEFHQTAKRIKNIFIDTPTEGGSRKLAKQLLTETQQFLEGQSNG